MLCQSAQASLNAVIYGKCLLFLRKGILGYGELRLVTQMLPDCVTDPQENPLTPRLFAKDVNFPPRNSPWGEDIWSPLLGSVRLCPTSLFLH